MSHHDESLQGTELTLVAVHGNGGGAHRFARVQPFLPDAVDFRAVTLPGFAGAPPDPALRSLRDYAGYLHRWIEEPAGSLFLLGTGIGGSLALEYAQHYAADLGGLILHAPVGARLDRRFFPRLMRLPGVARLGRYFFSSRLTRLLVRRLLFHTSLPDTYVDRFFDEYRRCSVFEQMFRLIDAVWFQGLAPVKVPTALLWGSRERILGADQLRDFQALLPCHTVRVVPGWNHFPMIEQPVAYAAEIVTLVQELTTMAPDA